MRERCGFQQGTGPDARSQGCSTLQIQPTEPCHPAHQAPHSTKTWQGAGPDPDAWAACMRPYPGVWGGGSTGPNHGAWDLIQPVDCSHAIQLVHGAKSPEHHCSRLCLFRILIKAHKPLGMKFLGALFF